MSQQQPDSHAPDVKHVEASPEETLKYWTAEKKRKAKPAHQPHVKDPGQEQPSQHTPQSSDPHKA
jgi:hypothetical protein